MKFRTNPLIRRVVRGVDWTVKPSLPITRGQVSPAIKELLSTPTWSVRSLLPSSLDTKGSPSPNSSPARSSNPAPSTESDITPSKLQHLLRLSALPPPSTPAEEAKLLKSLRTHIHFVRAIQAVDTTHVEPLINIRDETPEGIARQTVTLDKLQPYLDLEEKVGRNGTVRRRGKVDLEDEGNKRKEMRDWWVDIWRLGAGGESRKKGNYLFVKREKKNKKEERHDVKVPGVEFQNEENGLLLDKKNG